MVYMRIPNWVSLVGLVLFAACCVMIPWDELVLRLAVAGTVFAVGFALFCCRVIAGGDVKILAVLVLFLPANSLSLFGVLFSFALLFSVALVVGMRAIPRAKTPNWVSIRAQGTLPMGVAIGLAGFAHLCLLWAHETIALV